MITFKFITLLCIAATQCTADTKYTPNWKSLDSRPLPQWYDDAKFGIFLHWGVYSVPSFGSEWFWNYLEDGRPEFVEFMQKNYKPNFTYQEFAKDFTAEFYNATQWTKLFQAAGAKYIVLTSKHHEGYTLWPSKYSFSWNAKEVGPHRDLIGEMATAIKRTDIKFGLYHSLFEWYNPLWLTDKKNLFTTNTFVDNKIIPELKELVQTYKPEILWSDGDAGAPAVYWKSRQFLSWLYNDSPVKDTVVTNDRWGLLTSCKHGDFYSCADRYNPGINNFDINKLAVGVLQRHKWENCMTIDRKSWGYRRNAQLKDYMSLEELIKELVSTVSCGGNLLINIGPTKDGIIAPVFEERLREIGQWLEVNGEAIYKTKPWKFQNDSLNGDVWYTMSSDELPSFVYASFLKWPDNDTLKLAAVQSILPNTKISLLGNNDVLNWTREANYLEVHLPLSAHKGKPAWVIRLENHY